MEWMLQVVDEIDDAFGALRQWCVGLGAEIGIVLAAAVGFAAIAAAVITGAQITLLCAVAGTLATAALLKIHARQLPTAH
jgi:hypothetical protein